MSAHLSSSRVNLSILRESARRELLECLDKCIGTKDHDVTRMFPLTFGKLQQTNVQNIIFIVQPKLALMEIVADNVRKEETAPGPKKEFHMFFVPRKTLLCERKLQELGVYGTFKTVDEYSLEMFPFDSDLLSMELEGSFRECCIHEDYTSLYNAAKSLMTLQALYGVIPYIHGKGQWAKHVCDMMLRMRRELGGSEPQIVPQIDSLLLLDRTVDLLTPLATQLTYEGLIDEIFGIKNTVVQLPMEKFSSADVHGGASAMVPEPKKFILNSLEELYADIRDRNFNAVGQVLSRKAKAISAQFEERHGAKTVGEIKQFVSKLPHIQAAKESLANHTSIAELVKEVTDTDEFIEALHTQQEFMNGLETDKIHPFIEDCIAKQEPLTKVLRLLCLQCVANNGFKQKNLEYYKREILQTYGFQHTLTLSNLEKAGLLKVQTNRTYGAIRKGLRLIIEDVSEQSPTDVSYVYSGYAPVLVRLAQFLARPGQGWRTIEEVMDLLPGPKIEVSQEIPTGLKKKRGSVSSLQSEEDKKIMLVYFLGGVTYAEIAALRFLSHQEDSSTEYIIATTKIINGDTWLDSVSETIPTIPIADLRR
ncbi:PREDICTED: vacuolar protein sorting-associated protein 33A-like isoform X2 [Priapulus caudatus]|uniref:Vacuolar protein sorting-associated protein 33A-like isoform X2 n=1 Tax=Priapulus caudatus TaxID=37621 RepID=A0ABM1DVR1_PRICU|nr:PREDICTED: vacuolar protein sorting-associated protein 33A-like isoform X2 [Priapulus caudatus]